jgi:hypothetical protein
VLRAGTELGPRHGRLHGTSPALGTKHEHESAEPLEDARQIRRRYTGPLSSTRRTRASPTASTFTVRPDDCLNSHSQGHAAHIL